MANVNSMAMSLRLTWFYFAIRQGRGVLFSCFVNI